MVQASVPVYEVGSGAQRAHHARLLLLAREQPTCMTEAHHVHFSWCNQC